MIPRPWISSIVVLVGTALGAGPQGNPSTPKTPLPAAPEVVGVGTSIVDYDFAAKLIRPEKNIRLRRASVEVTLKDFRLKEPSPVPQEAVRGEGHLEYRLDAGPVIASASPRMDFLNLSDGPHQIIVTLVGNDNKPVGPQKVLLPVISGVEGM